MVRSLPSCCIALCIFFFFLCIVCFVTFPVLFVCICVLYYCHRVATQLQLNISYIIFSDPEVEHTRILRNLWTHSPNGTATSRRPVPLWAPPMLQHDIPPAPDTSAVRLVALSLYSLSCSDPEVIITIIMKVNCRHNLQRCVRACSHCFTFGSTRRNWALRTVAMSAASSIK
jgi:hypothetical protein